MDTYEPIPAYVIKYKTSKHHLFMQIIVSLTNHIIIIQIKHVNMPAGYQIQLPIIAMNCIHIHYMGTGPNKVYSHTTLHVMIMNMNTI